MCITNILTQKTHAQKVESNREGMDKRYGQYKKDAIIS